MVRDPWAWLSTGSLLLDAVRRAALQGGAALEGPRRQRVRGEAGRGAARRACLLAGKTYCRCPGMSANAAAVKALRKAREETPEEEVWEGLRLSIS